MKPGYVNNWPNALEMVRDARYREMKADTAETVEVVHRSGGVAIIVHPGRGERERKNSRFTPLVCLTKCVLKFPSRYRSLLSHTHT